MVQKQRSIKYTSLTGMKWRYTREFHHWTFQLEVGSTCQNPRNGTNKQNSVVPKLVSEFEPKKIAYVGKGVSYSICIIGHASDLHYQRQLQLHGQMTFCFPFGTKSEVT